MNQFTNDQGKLSLQDLQDFAVSKGGLGLEDRIAEEFRILDQDADGYITIEEFQHWLGIVGAAPTSPLQRRPSDGLLGAVPVGQEVRRVSINSPYGGLPGGSPDAEVATQLSFLGQRSLSAKRSSCNASPLAEAEPSTIKSRRSSADSISLASNPSTHRSRRLSAPALSEQTPRKRQPSQVWGMGTRGLDGEDIWSDDSQSGKRRKSSIVRQVNHLTVEMEKLRSQLRHETQRRMFAEQELQTVLHPADGDENGAVPMAEYERLHGAEMEAAERKHQLEEQLEDLQRQLYMNDSSSSVNAESHRSSIHAINRHRRAITMQKLVFSPPSSARSSVSSSSRQVYYSHTTQ